MKIWKDQQFNPFDWFEGWERLPPGTRRLFLREIGSNLAVDGDAFSDETRQQLLETGFLQEGKQRLKDEVRPFRNLVRSMDRHRHFDRRGQDLPVDYVSDHLTSEECSVLPGKRGFRFGRNANAVANEVVEASWLRTFIDCNSEDEWENRASIHDHAYFSPASFKLLQRWVQRLLGGDNPLLMAALLEDAGGDALLAADALRGAIHYMLLFPALEGEEQLPVVGIWPTIHERMTRPRAKAPAAGALPDGYRVYDVPLLLHDMTAILVAVSGEGLRLKADGASLFKRDETVLEASMPENPPAGCDYIPPYYGRIAPAKDWLVEMKLASVRGGKKEKRLAASESGRAWLAGSESERLKTLHDHMHAARRRFARGGWVYYDSGLAFAPVNPQNHVREGGLNLEDLVAQAFEGCPVGEWIGRDAFLKWRSESGNPFHGLDTTLERVFNHPWSNKDAYREEQWRKVLRGFLYERLLMLGGAKLAFDAAGDIRFSITPAGAYLLGARSEFEYATAPVSGTILAQPDYSIVFTAPNPHAESELALFSERTGNGVGTLFKITHSSVLRALNAGQDGERICAILRSLCGPGVPANVQRQILDWGRAYRRVAFRQIQVVECPDADTAMLVCGLFPQKTSRLTDTLVKIEHAGKTLEPLKKKLRENGVGIE